VWFFFSSRRRHTRFSRDWSSDVCSSDLTMLPYLAALGLVGTQGPGWPTSALWVAGYCVVMVAPALVLTAARVVAARLVERPLGRLDAWLTRNAASTTAWVVGIVGFLVARDAVGRLWG